MATDGDFEIPGDERRADGRRTVGWKVFKGSSSYNGYNRLVASDALDLQTTSAQIFSVRIEIDLCDSILGSAFSLVSSGSATVQFDLSPYNTIVLLFSSSVYTYGS